MRKMTFIEDMYTRRRKEKERGEEKEGERKIDMKRENPFKKKRIQWERRAEECKT